MQRHEYTESILAEDKELQRIRQSAEERGMPPISVPPELGRLLEILVRGFGARRVLEIGALAGYSGLCLARGLQEGGEIVSLELNPAYAMLARQNIERGGHGGKVQHIVGPAIDSLKNLREQGQRFDFFFIDADKITYPQYLEHCIALAAPGALICADNALLHDRILDLGNHEPETEAMREFNQMVVSDPRLRGVILPVRDGFAIAQVRA